MELSRATEAERYLERRRAAELARSAMVLAVALILLAVATVLTILFPRKDPFIPSELSDANGPQLFPDRNVRGARSVHGDSDHRRPIPCVASGILRPGCAPQVPSGGARHVERAPGNGAQARPGKAGRRLAQILGVDGSAEAAARADAGRVTAGERVVCLEPSQVKWSAP